MQASEIILDSHIFKDANRGEALERLADLVFEHYGSNDDHLSNGAPIDAILVLFDRLITDNNDQEMGLIASIENLRDT